MSDALTYRPVAKDPTLPQPGWMRCAPVFLVMVYPNGATLTAGQYPSEESAKAECPEPFESGCRTSVRGGWQIWDC